MKIRLQTKRGLNTLKFGGYSEILTLFLRGNLKSGYNVSILLLGGLQQPPSLLRERVNVNVHGRCGEEGLPKFNPRSGRELNPEPLGWQSETLPVALTSQISNHCSHWG